MKEEKNEVSGHGKENEKAIVEKEIREGRGEIVLVGNKVSIHRKL